MLTRTCDGDIIFRIRMTHHAQGSLDRSRARARAPQDEGSRSRRAEERSRLPWEKIIFTLCRELELFLRFLIRNQKTRKALHWGRKPAPYRAIPALAQASPGSIDPHRKTDRCKPHNADRWQGVHGRALLYPSLADRAFHAYFAIGARPYKCWTRPSPGPHHHRRGKLIK